MAEIEAGSLYDINKSIIEQVEKPLTEDEIKETIENNIFPYFDKHCTTVYFMLLCNDKRDYTIFNIHSYMEDEILVEIAETLIECLENRGSIYSIEPTEDGVALEIWIKYNNEEMVCYYLFPYDEGVIEI